MPPELEEDYRQWLYDNGLYDDTLLKVPGLNYTPVYRVPDPNAPIVCYPDPRTRQRVCKRDD